MRFARRLVVASSASARRHGSLAEARLTAASLTVPSPSLIIASRRAAIRSLGRGRRGLAVVSPQLERFTRRWRNASALRVMLAWTEFARTTSATRAKLSVVRARLVNHCLARCLAGWVAAHTVRARRRATLAHFSAKWNNRHAFAVFAAWCVAVSGWRRDRVLIARCALKFRRRLEVRSLEAWRAFADGELATKASMRRILCRMISAYTGRGFHHWRRQLRAEDDAARAAADAAAAEAAREAAEEAALAAKLAKVGGL